MSSGYPWGYSRPGGNVPLDKLDFIGVAIHEMGHAMGFVSGVDAVDQNSPPNKPALLADQLDFVGPLDLFRWSTDSAGVGVLDFTADSRDKFFSVDRGATVGPSFTTGFFFGDGWQAGHWKDSLGLGVMSPSLGEGQLLSISENDLRAMDAIGWNLAAPIPEPATALLFGLGAAAIGLRRRRAKAV